MTPISLFIYIFNYEILVYELLSTHTDVTP